MYVCVRSVGLGAVNGVLALGLTTICCPVLSLTYERSSACCGLGIHAYRVLACGIYVTVCQILRAYSDPFTGWNCIWVIMLHS